MLLQIVPAGCVAAQDNVFVDSSRSLQNCLSALRREQEEDDIEGGLHLVQPALLIKCTAYPLSQLPSSSPQHHAHA